MLFGSTLGIAILLRVFVTWGVVNDYFPDELFQYREQAHRLVFGYGFMPWEYEWGARNWAIPGAIAAVLWTLDLIGLGRPEIYDPVLSAVAIAISMTLVFSARRLATSLAGPTAGLLAAGGIAMSFPCISSASKLTPEVLAAYALMGALALAVDGGTRRLAMAGALAGGAIGLRFQYSPIIALLGIAVLCRRPGIAGILAWGISLLAVLAGFGALDFMTWGAPFASYLRATSVNLSQGSGAFGASPFYVYLRTLSVIGAVYIGCALFNPRRSWLPLACAVVLVGLHMAIDHKEPRYIFAAHSLLVVAAAVGLIGKTRWIGFAIRLSVVIVVVSVARFILTSDHYFQAAADMKAAFLALRRDPDLRALAIRDIEFGSVAGYFTLHRNLPIQLAEMRHPHDDMLGAGFTHIAVPRHFPEVSGFVPWATFGTVTVRKRRHIDPMATLPETTRLLPIAFTPGIGMHYRQAPEPRMDSTSKAVPNGTQ